MQGCLGISDRLGQGNVLPDHRSPREKEPHKLCSERDEQDHLDLLQLSTRQSPKLTCTNGFLGLGIHDSSVAELQESLSPYEFLHPSHFSSPISTLAIGGLFIAFERVHHCG